LGVQLIVDISKTISDSIYRAYEQKLITMVRENPIPKHIAIIMDGNRRFARSLGLAPTEGHELGRNKLEELLEWCLDLKIRILTVYAFSTENLKRELEEVETLMDLFEKNFKLLAEDQRVHKHKIKVKVFGQTELLPQIVQDAIHLAEETTKDYDNYFYNLCIAYGGREEIIQAVKKIAGDVKDGKIDIDNINEELMSKHLYTSDYPDPELILRTSGEERMSNFLLWQLAYSELYFADVYWPGFRRADFLRAIRSYQQRQRRYGT